MGFPSLRQQLDPDKGVLYAILTLRGRTHRPLDIDFRRLRVILKEEFDHAPAIEFESLDRTL